MSAFSAAPNLSVGDLCFVELSDPEEFRRGRGVVVEVRGGGSTVVLAVGMHLYKISGGLFIDSLRFLDVDPETWEHQVHFCRRVCLTQ